jgi:hypothetical protein
VRARWRGMLDFPAVLLCRVLAFALTTPGVAIIAPVARAWLSVIYSSDSWEDQVLEVPRTLRSALLPRLVSLWSSAREIKTGTAGSAVRKAFFWTWCRDAAHHLTPRALLAKQDEPHRSFIATRPVGVANRAVAVVTGYMPGFEIGITNADDIDSLLACQLAGWPQGDHDVSFLRFRVEDPNFNSLHDVGLLLNGVDLTDDPAVELPDACGGEIDTETRCILRIEWDRSEFGLSINGKNLARYNVEDITVFAHDTAFLAVCFDDDVGFDSFELCPAPRVRG